MNQGTIIKVNTQPTNFQHLIQHSKTRIKEKKRATYSTLAQRHPQTYRHTHTRTHARYIHFLYWLFERVIESTKKKREQKSSLSLFLSSSLFVIPCFKDYSYFFFFFLQQSFSFWNLLSSWIYQHIFITHTSCWFSLSSSTSIYHLTN